MALSEHDNIRELLALAAAGALLTDGAAGAALGEALGAAVDAHAAEAKVMNNPAPAVPVSFRNPRRDRGRVRTMPPGTDHSVSSASRLV